MQSYLVSAEPYVVEQALRVESTNWIADAGKLACYNNPRCSELLTIKRGTLMTSEEFLLAKQAPPSGFSIVILCNPRTRIARIQAKLAQWNYLLPPITIRLIGWFPGQLYSYKYDKSMYLLVYEPENAAKLLTRLPQYANYRPAEAFFELPLH